MTSICPVCNGFSSLQPLCAHCRHAADDLGRYSDMFGPYSPYREIDAMKMTNGYLDHAHGQCAHLCRCSTCQHSFVYLVDELR